MSTFRFYTDPPQEEVTTSAAWWTTEPSSRDPYNCTNYCDNGGLCTYTGPALTAICSCNSGFRGTYCEQVVLWFEFFVRDNKLTGNGFAALFCIAVSLAIVGFAGYILYRRRRRSRSRPNKAPPRPDRPDLSRSKEELLHTVYNISSPTSRSSASPAAAPPTTQAGQGICYLLPTSPPPHSPPTDSQPMAWQDFHNPGYRSSYIADSRV